MRCQVGYLFGLQFLEPLSGLGGRKFAVHAEAGDEHATVDPRLHRGGQDERIRQWSSQAGLVPLGEDVPAGVHHHELVGIQRGSGLPQELRHPHHTSVGLQQQQRERDASSQARQRGLADVQHGSRLDLGNAPEVPEPPKVAAPARPGRRIDHEPIPGVGHNRRDAQVGQRRGEHGGRHGVAPASGGDRYRCSGHGADSGTLASGIGHPEEKLPEIEEILPKYLQIAGYLRDQIVRGDLVPGAEVPSIREIAVQWDVARPTASKALAKLREQGLVESRTGSGTYVRAPHAAPRARERFERAAKLGTAYSESESVTFPLVGVVDAPEFVASMLGLQVGEPVIQRQRVISNDEGPIELSTSWFAAAMGDVAPRLLLPERVGGGTVKLIADALQIRPVYAREQLCARSATAAEASTLSLSDTAVLVCWLTVHDSGGRPLEFDEAVYASNRWAYRQEFPVDL